VIGLVGFGLFLYGKKQQRIPQLGVGLALMVYPYFVPSAVWMGSRPVPPEAYLATLARIAQLRLNGKALPETIEIKPAKLAAARYVSDDDPAKLWGWVIFPPGFRAPALMELAKKQSWTLKPALLDRSSER